LASRLTPSQASPFKIDPPIQSELIELILHDLKVASNGSKGKLSFKGASLLSFSTHATDFSLSDAAQGLLAVKNLGKNPSSSEYLSSSTHLSTLLALFTAFKDYPDASSEALRCIANTLLLVENARSTFIQREVNGGIICISLLEVGYLCLPLDPPHASC